MDKLISCLLGAIYFILFNGVFSLEDGGYYPLDIDETDFYLTTRKGGPPSAVIEDLKRSQEGVLVKLLTLSKKIDDDELKLNNIFYKIGHHDTELGSFGDQVNKLGKSTKRTETKLNRHAFNVEFLGRQIRDVQKTLEDGIKDKEKIRSLQRNVDHLEEKLTEAIFKVSNLEREQKFQSDATSQYASGRSSIVVRSEEGVSRPACHTGWISIGTECLYQSKKTKTFAQAMASCIKMNSALSSLFELSEKEAQTLLATGKAYWTSATNLFSNKEWLFLLDGQTVEQSRWQWIKPDKRNPRLAKRRHCATLSKMGLESNYCDDQSYFICRSLQ